MKYLLDTCIWRDFYENRLSKSGRDLGKSSNDIFIKILKNKENIVFSESLLWELSKDYNEKDINDMLNLLFMNGVLIRIDITKNEYKEAKKLCKNRSLPLVDCLLAVQARNHSALLVTQDKHLLKNLSDITKAVKPEDIT